MEMNIINPINHALIDNLTLTINFHASSRCTNMPRIAYTKALAVIH